MVFRTMIDGIHKPEPDHIEFAETVAASKKLSAMKLFPYADGGCVYYPVGLLWKGYALSQRQAETLMASIKAKGMTFNQYLLLAAAIIFVFMNFFEDSVKNSNWFWLLLITIVIFDLTFGNWRRTKQFLAKFPGVEPCRHPFPHEYLRLRKFSKWIFKPVPSTFCGLFMLICGIAAIFHPAWRAYDGPPVWFMVLGGFIMLATSAYYFRMTYFQFRFRRINGRIPSVRDLQPIDRISGRMSPSPFDYPK